MPTTVSNSRSANAETIRQLRLKLAKTGDEQERHLLLRQIEQLEEEAKAPPEE